MEAVLVVVGGFPSVPQTFVLREVQAMRQAGWHVHVLASEPSDTVAWQQAQRFGISQEDVTFLNWRDCWPRPRLSARNIKKWLDAGDVVSYGPRLALSR